MSSTLFANAQMFGGMPITKRGSCANQGTLPTQDFDCDGVINSTDLDDDNDGILDEDESNFTVVNFDPNPASGSYRTNGYYYSERTGIHWNEPQLWGRSWGSPNDTGDYRFFSGSLFNGVPSRIRGVRTMGSRDTGEWSTSYELLGTKDGSNWISLGFYPGNTNNSTLVYRSVDNFDRNWLGLLIRPTGGVGYPSLRFQFDLLTSFSSKNTNNFANEDPYAIDSDGDGCNDVVESGGIDANNDGKLDGTGVDALGRVTGGSGGYNGVNGNEFLAQNINITTPPANVIKLSGTATFSAGAILQSTSIYNNGVPDYSSSTSSLAGFSYQWFDGNPAAGGLQLTNSGIYSGVNTNTLNISNIAGLDQKQFFLKISNSNVVCTGVVSARVIIGDPCIYGATFGTPTPNDPDGDGINNSCDLDDDNDGIPDSVECADLLLNPNSGSASYVQSGAFSGLNSPELTSVTSWAGASNTDVNQFVGMRFSPQQIQGITIRGRGDFAQWVTSFQLQATKDGTSWVSLGTFTGNSDQNTSVFRAVENSDMDWVGLRINPLTWNGHPSLRFQITLRPACDMDSDNIVNVFDRDSDGDGCSDAFEGGATTDKTANFVFNGAVGSNGLLNSLETNIDNGVLNYIPTYSIALDKWYNVCTSTLAFNSAGVTRNGTLQVGTAASNVSFSVPYTGGIGEGYPPLSINSTGVPGLVATLTAGNYVTGSGVITFNISGTPSGSGGTASFVVNISGKSFTITYDVSAAPPPPPPPPPEPICFTNSASRDFRVGVFVNENVDMFMKYTSAMSLPAHSTTVNGLTFSAPASSFPASSGALNRNYTVSGTPTSVASNYVYLNGAGCTLRLGVNVVP